jgi:hypothetical protein
MATREEEQKQRPRSIGGAMGGTLGSNLQLGGFGNPMGFTPPNPPSVFGASTQQSSQDFSRLQVPPTPSIPLGNTVPVFPDNYNRVMGERMRTPSSMVSGIREGSRQQAEQMGTMPRTPQQQQALLDNIRKNAPALNQQRTDWVQNAIQQRRENPTTYTTPSGKNVAVPTNRFGEPLKAWMGQTASAASSQPAVQGGGLNSGILASTGFGAMQREQNEMMPPPIRSQSLFGNMGYASTFGGGPQPASPMLTGNSMVGRTRKRLFGTV